MPLGPPTEIPVAPMVGGGLSIAWNGQGWGVLYTDPQRSAFQLLDRGGDPVAALRRFSMGGASGQLEYSDGRYAAVVSGGDGGAIRSHIALLDRRGVLAAGWSDLGLLGQQTDVARLDHGDGWVTASGSGQRPVDAAEVGPLARVRSRLDVGAPPNTRPRLAALRSRVVAFWLSDESMMARVLTHPIADSSAPAVEVLRLSTFTSFAATRLRDQAVVMTSEGSPGGGQFASYDPFDGRLVHSRPLDLGGQPMIRYLHDAIGLDASNLVAACFGVSAGGEGQVELHLFTGDGRRAARPVTVGALPGSLGVAPCAVGTDGERIFVAWQRRTDGEIHVRGYALPR